MAAADPSVSKSRLVRYFFFAAFLALLYETFQLFAAFYLPLLAAGLLAATVYPLHLRLTRALPGRASLTAALSAAGTLLVVVLPLCALGWVFFNEASKIAPEAQRWAETVHALHPGPQGRIGVWAARAAALLPGASVGPETVLVRSLDALASWAGSLAAALLRHLVGVAVDLAALAVTLFMFLRDGPRMLRALLDLVPLPAEEKELLRARVVETLFAVLHGVLAVAVIQGTLAGLGLAFFHVPFPVLLGALTTFAAPVPVLGTGLVLGPVVAALYLFGSVGQAVKVGLWSFCFVGILDSVLRPFVIGSQARLPVWLLFLGLLGGMELYGFAGLIIGPVVVSLALALANLYHREYELLPLGRSQTSE